MGQRAIKVISMFLAAHLGLSGIASACAFHNYKPTKTMVDWLLHSDTVALARPNTENAFKYSVSAIYRGSDVATEIPFLIDSSTRRTLAENPNDGVLFGFNNGGVWRRIGYMNTQYRKIAETVLTRAEEWRSAEFHPDRFAFFANYQDHPDRTIRYLALQEIDRVPYKLLRTMNVRLSERDLMRSLKTMSEINYRSINVLLLGLKGTDTARSYVSQQMLRLAKSDLTSELGAVATALVELEGDKGVETLERLYLNNRTHSLTKLEVIIEALAIHNEIGTEEVRQAIARVLADFLSLRPNAAAIVARQFSSRQDWSFGPKLKALLASPAPMTASSRLIANVYVAQARANRDNAGTKGEISQ